MPDSEQVTVIANAQGEILHVSRSGEDLFGVPTKALIGQALTHLMPARYREDHTRHLMAASARIRQSAEGFERGFLRVFALHGIHHQTEVPVEIALLGWCGGDGEPVFLATIRTTHERPG